MSLPNLTFIAPTPFWSIQCKSGNSYTANSLGVISALSSDANDLENGGCTFAISRHALYTTPGAPAALNAAVTVSSVAFSNGTLTIAAQPDVPRQLAIIINNPSTSTITAGLLTLTYLANDGTTQTDLISAAGQAGTLTLNTSKGVEHVVTNGAIVTGVAGGTSPGIQIGTNNYLAVPLEPGFSSWAVTKETKITPTNGTLGLSVPADETVSTLTTSNGLISPTQAPDGTHGLSFLYGYTMPATFPA